MNFEGFVIYCAVLDTIHGLILRKRALMDERDMEDDGVRFE